MSVLIACVCPVAAETVGDQRCAPEFIQPLEKTEAREGEVARLECRVIGNPMPQITWLKDDVEIRPSEDFKIFYDEDNLCSLVIQDAFIDDAGTYTVIAKNELGTVTSSADLIILGKWLSDTRTGERNKGR